MATDTKHLGLTRDELQPGDRVRNRISGNVGIAEGNERTGLVYAPSGLLFVAYRDDNSRDTYT